MHNFNGIYSTWNWIFLKNEFVWSGLERTDPYTSLYCCSMTDPEIAVSFLHIRTHTLHSLTMTDDSHKPGWTHYCVLPEEGGGLTNVFGWQGGESERGHIPVLQWIFLMVLPYKSSRGQISIFILGSWQMERRNFYCSIFSEVHR